MEIFVVDGMSDDGTRSIVNDYIKKYPYITLLDNEDKIVPRAMNIGIQAAKGDYIIRLDAHSQFPKNYFSKLVEASVELKADNVGAVAITDVKNKTIKSNAIIKVLSHRFGVGNSDFRTGVKNIKEVDTVPFGCFKRDVFDKYGLYDTRLVRNQDIELNKRIKNGGGKIFLIPGVEFIYFARESFSKLYKNNYENGLWNILTAYYTDSLKSLSLRHFVPLFYILSIVVPSLLAIIEIKFLLISALSFSLHSLLLLIFSIKENSEDTSVLNLIIAFLTLHYSYGIGSVSGIFRLIKLRYFKWAEKR